VSKTPTKLRVVLVEDRLVLVDVVRRVEDDGLAVRDKNVRKTAFPRTRDLDERAVEIDRNLRVPMDAAPAVHPVGERHRVVAQLAEDVRRRLRDDALAADGDDLRVIGEIGEGRLGPFRVCGQLVVDVDVDATWDVQSSNSPSWRISRTSGPSSSPRNCSLSASGDSFCIGTPE